MIQEKYPLYYGTPEGTLLFRHFSVEKLKKENEKWKSKE